MPKLPVLRRALDIMPWPEENRPGLLIRDPFHYTQGVLFVPSIWALALSCLDGEHTELDAQAILVRASGDLVFSHQIQEFVDVLRKEGFLETEEFYRLREQKHKDFEEAPERAAAHAGTAYPASPPEVHSKFEEYFAAVDGEGGLAPNVVGMAAPHVSPEGGRNCYAKTYRRLAASPALADRTFIVLGTSHWGEPDKFGLTGKPFVTPLGTLRVDTEMEGWLEEHGGNAISREDYCHSMEHSIEFQCVFLQHALGSDLKILPILCGPFIRGLQHGGVPEDDDAVARFLDALGELAAKHSGRVFWVLGIDLAHMGRRYGESFTAIADQGSMTEVAEQDRQRLHLACAGESRQFSELVNSNGNGDALKWCGYSALYTFLKAANQARGRLLGYEQWNIDPQSVVSFTSLEFHAP